MTAPTPDEYIGRPPEGVRADLGAARRSARARLRSTVTRLAAALALSSAFCATAAEAPVVVKDPHYGDTLFHFYQDRYFTSVTTLMASQHFNRVSRHADEAEVLRGGLLLSYGLHREAGEIFARLIDQGAAPSVRDRAWFFLAKIRYQRGLDAQALEAIARIGDALPPELDDERGLLHANLLMARGDNAGAAELLNRITQRSGASAYARFNLGVALVKSGDTARGAALLDEVGRMPVDGEEQRSLRDKANVALGFAALMDQRPQDARTALERVRLEGLHSNKALLGFGWAAAALKQPQLALVPWLELAGRPLADSASLEAQIAVPFAFAELGALGQSLQRYEDAIRLFERESAGLDESIAAIREGKLVDGLLVHNPGTEMGWFWQIRALPEMPHAGHLSHVLAQHEFQEAFKNLRDLRFLAGNLAEWRDKLGVYGDMLAHRRQAYAERLPKVRQGAKAGHGGLDDLSRRRDALAGEFQQADANADGREFADAKERDLLERLARVQDALKQLGDDPAYAAAREKARMASGALTWQLARAHPARAWDARKGLSAIDQGLTEARSRDEALARAQHDEPARFEAFAARLAALDTRLAALAPNVAALGKEQQQVVQDIAVAELQRQKERLAAYTVQARFALAQLHDRATAQANTTEGRDATRP